MLTIYKILDKKEGFLFVESIKCVPLQSDYYNGDELRVPGTGVLIVSLLAESHG